MLLELRCTLARTTLQTDQDQTPEHPKGDGSCVLPCDCGGVPCGEYLWDHRNASLRDYLVNTFVLGPLGLGNENISGIFLDDGWTNTSHAVLPWEPQPEGYCDHSPIGGATEEDSFCVEDMGLVQADTTAITDAHDATMAAVEAAVLAAGGFAWQYLTSTQLPVGPGPVCSNFFRDAAGWSTRAALMMSWNWPNTSAPTLPYVMEDIAAFLLLRGPYAWLGFGWSGCLTYYPFPDELYMDVGTPIAPFHETVPGASNVFVRNYTNAFVSFDCNVWVGNVTLLG